MDTAQRKLNRRDYILVPLIAIATISVMLAGAELGTRAIWPEDSFNTCVAFDKLSVLRTTPNCTSRTKIAEGPWVTYHFNECGYRTFDSCGAKPAGALRIVLLGTSVGEGLHVRFEESMGERTRKALEAATGRQVQIENLAMATMTPLFSYRKLGEAIRLHPDLVVYSVAPLDVGEPMDPEELANRNTSREVHKNASARPNTPLKRLQNMLNNSRTFLIAQHFLFSNNQTFLRLFMGYGDRADPLRVPVPPAWQAHLENFSLLMTDMASRLHAAGIPLILMAVPSRPAMALLNVPNPPPHTDAFAFSREMQAMAARLDIGFVDGMPEFARTPHSDHMFYMVDYHPTGEAHGLLAKSLTSKILDGSIPAFKEKKAN